LADKIETMLTGEVKLFDTQANETIQKYAKEFYDKIIEKQLYDVEKKTTTKETSPHISDYPNVDINTLETGQAKEIGAEWLVYQAIEQLEMQQMFKESGFNQKEIKTAIAHIISRSVYPASEHKTAQWINENSGLLQLPFLKDLKINKNHLYKISKKLHTIKDESEKFLSTKTQ